jgi:hypothetical protein
MVEGNAEGNEEERKQEEVTLRTIRDEIRSQGTKIRNDHWLTTGLAVGAVLFAGGIGILTTPYRGLGLTMVLVSAVFIGFVVVLNSRRKD